MFNIRRKTRYITAKDEEYLNALKKAADFSCKVGIKNKGKKNQSYQLQIGSVALYQFLLSCGLVPKKSLIQKAINVPESFFSDFCRGVIDGDGNIRRWVNPSNQSEQWTLRIYGSSREFIDWLQQSIETFHGVKGKIYPKIQPGRSEAYILKYGKIAAQEILRNCYYKDAIALNRKAILAEECCAAQRGWSRSKTIQTSN